jgi:predicted ester cyclase
MVGEGDEVAVYVQIDITYLAYYDGADAAPSLGKPVTWRNMEMMRIVDGKLVSHVSEGGMTDMLVREGALAPRKSVSA